MQRQSTRFKTLLFSPILNVQILPKFPTPIEGNNKEITNAEFDVLFTHFTINF